MSLRNGQKVSRRAHRTGREALRRACQSVVGAPATSRWETLENRLMMTISQIDPTYVVFEGEHADATIAAGSNGSTWMALGGAGVAGNASLPSDGKALVAIGQSTDVGNDRTTGSVSYPINFTTPGVYRMYVRGKFTGGGDNSFWIPNHPADGTGPINADPGSPNNNPFDNHNADTIRVGNYRWFGSDSADVPVTYTVGAAGDTTLTYRVREQGYMIDKVVLSRNLSLTAADLDALAGIGAQPTAGSVVAHYYNDNFWGINGASGTDSRPSAPSAGLAFPEETIFVARAGDIVKSMPQVNSNWGTGSPDPAIRPDNHSTVHVGKLTAPETGTYQILGFGDDDTHVFLNGQFVSSNPGGHGIEDPRGAGSTGRGGGAVPIDLVAGTQYDLVVLQAEGGGGSGVILEWITPSMTAQLGDAAPPLVVPSQYFAPAEPAPAAPTNVAQTNTLANGSAVPAGAVAFSFTDNALNELRYEVQRSTDGGTTWVRAGTFEPIVSNDNGAPKADAVVVAPAPLPGNSAVYRVVAWNYAGIGASGASAEISSPPAADVPGVSAYYFNDQFWKGYPNGTIAAPSRSNAANDIIIGRDADAAAVVPNVAFDWGMGSPVANVIQVDNHSTVHTGKIHITTPGTYIIGGRSDDDSYVWLENQLVGAHPGGHGPPGSISDIPVKNSIDLAEGDYNFVAVQSEGGWGSAIWLQWIAPGDATPVNVPDEAFVSSLPDVPTAPTGLTGVSPAKSLASLSFTDTSTSEVRYALQRSLTPFTDLQGAAPAGTTEVLLPIVAQNTNPAGAADADIAAAYLDAGLTANTTYYYRLRAENFRGSSEWVGATVTTRATDPVPSAPTNLVAYGLGTRNQLTFTDTSTTEDHFVVERKLASDPDTAWAALTNIPASAAGSTGQITYYDTPVDEAILYQYRIRAANSDNQTSNPTNVATANQVGLKATIYDTMTLTDDPANPNDPLVRVDPFIDFNFDALPGASPDPRIGADTFSIHWEGVFTPREGGDYIFHGWSDDGIRVWLDGKLIVNAWIDRGRAETASEPVTLEAGTDHTLVVEYYENGGGANVTLEVEVNGARRVPGVDELSRKKIPLQAPGDVTAKNTLAECITVLWSDSNNQETGYEVQRSTTADFSSGVQTVGTTGADKSQLVDMLPQTAGATYYYRVRALGTPSASAYSAASEGVTPGAPASRANINFADFADPATQALWTTNSAAQFRDADADAGGTLERLMLTDALDGQTGSAYLNDPRFVGSFKADFDFQVTDSNGADGFTFVLEAADNGTAALGGGGGYLGYTGIPNSFAVKYDYYPNPQTNVLGYFFNGEPVAGNPGGTGPDLGNLPNTRDIPTSFDLDNQGGQGQIYHSTISYDSSTKVLTVTLDDIGNDTTAPFVSTFNNVDIPNTMGSGCAYVGFTGATGGLHARQEILNFNFTNSTEVPPAAVTQVFVNGQGLTGQTTANGVAFRAAAGIDNTFGYPVSAGVNQTKSIPWVNGVNAISLRFSQDVGSQLQQGDLVVRGVNAATYTVNGFNYDAGTKTGTWTLGSPITNDKVRLFLDDALVSGLDGEWTNASATESYPSGNGTAGGDFDFRFNVLRGDATQDGRVNALDLSFIKQRLNKSATNPGTTGAVYSPFADLTGDGSVNALDLSAARARLNNALPTADPATALLFSSTSISR